MSQLPNVFLVRDKEDWETLNLLRKEWDPKNYVELKPGDPEAALDAELSQSSQEVTGAGLGASNQSTPSDNVQTVPKQVTFCLLLQQIHDIDSKKKYRLSFDTERRWTILNTPTF